MKIVARNAERVCSGICIMHCTAKITGNYGIIALDCNFFVVLEEIRS